MWNDAQAVQSEVTLLEDVLMVTTTRAILEPALLGILPNYTALLFV